MIKTLKSITVAVIPLALLYLMSCYNYAYAEESLSATNTLTESTEIILDYSGYDKSLEFENVPLLTESVRYGDLLSSNKVPNKSWIEANIKDFDGWNYESYSIQDLPDTNRVYISYYYWKNQDGVNANVREYIEDRINDENENGAKEFEEAMKQIEQKQQSNYSSNDLTTEDTSSAEESDGTVVGGEQEDNSGVDEDDNQSSSSTSNSSNVEQKENTSINHVLPITLSLIAIILAIGVTKWFKNEK